VKKWLSTLALYAACAGLTSSARAQTNESDDDLAGFGTSTEEVEPPQEQPATLDDSVGFAEVGAKASEPSTAPAPSSAPSSSLTLQGFYRGELGLWTLRVDNPLAKLRQSGDASLRYSTSHLKLVAGGHLEYDAAYLYARSQYDLATLDEYELVLVGGETYLSASLGSVELTLGRQIVAWGEADLLNIVDVPNPRDVREPGQAELDDLRLAVTASRLGWFSGHNRLELMVVHESYFGLRPPPLAYYSPLRAALLENAATAGVLQDKQLAYRDVPARFSLEEQQFFLRFARRGKHADYAFYAASLDYREGVLRLPTPAALAQTIIEVDLLHPRYTFLGHSMALPIGAFVLKWELAGNLQRPFNVGTLNDPGPALVQWKRYDAAEWMIGASYQPFSTLQFGLEAKQTQVFGGPSAGDPEFLLPVSAVWLGLRYTHMLFDERVQLNAVAISIGDPRRTGWLARGEATLSMENAMKLSVGYVRYDGGDEFGPLYGFGSHDRLFVRFRRDFTVQ
jgi:hypothetical protein